MSLLKHCADGNLKEIESILRHTKGRRSKVQVRDNHNWTCLHHAVKSGSVECIKFLLTINEIDTLAETFEGETALHIACTIANVSIEIVSMLVEANPDLVLFVNNEEVDLLQCAIIRNRLDIVKLLIANGAPVNKQDLDGDTALHIAAIELELDVIRYLLYETSIDSTICNESGKSACFLLFAKLLEIVKRNASLSPQQIQCFEELTQFTYNLYDSNNANDMESELNQMINIGYLYGEPRSCLYSSILKLFYVPPSKQYFYQKILQTNEVPSCHCLINALLDNININTDNSNFEIQSNFLLELFTLFLSDESFFNEYISEIMSNGWEYSERHQAEKFSAFITQRKDSLDLQKLFSFLKALILYGINFDILMIWCEIFLEPKLLFTVFTPLVQLVKPFYPQQCDLLSCSVKFNEPGNDLHHRNSTQVISLKDLCRMSIRRYYFGTYSHYAALKELYSLNIPIKIRNFLCYNARNFEF